MKLRYSPTSPYVRKVSVAIIELGMERAVGNVPTNVWDPGTDISEDNPLGKVPTLITDGGEVIYDSPVIIEFLDSLDRERDGGGDAAVRLIPEGGGDRWIALRHQALADGVTDAAVAVLLEGRRQQGERSPSWVERQEKVIARGLEALNLEADTERFREGGPTVGHIAIACMLGWYEFRFGVKWRKDCPALAQWFDGFSQRPSMKATEPKEAS